MPVGELRENVQVVAADAHLNGFIHLWPCSSCLTSIERLEYCGPARRGASPAALAHLFILVRVLTRI